MKILTTSALLVVLLLAAFALVSAGTVVRSELYSSDSLRDSTGGKDLSHTFSQRPESVRVSVSCKLKRGSFGWRVEDPDGKVLWREEVRAKASIELVEEIPGSAGEWHIVLDWAEASGKYDIKMQAVMPEAR